MNKTDFRRLFGYSDNCWRLLGETLADDSPTPEPWDTPFESTSRWNTIRLILAHTIGCEERWISNRIQNIPLPVVYEERAASDWGSNSAMSSATVSSATADRALAAASTRTNRALRGAARASSAAIPAPASSATSPAMECSRHADEKET